MKEPGWKVSPISFQPGTFSFPGTHPFIHLFGEPDEMPQA
jgi:hypothetical protein